MNIINVSTQEAAWGPLSFANKAWQPGLLDTLSRQACSSARRIFIWICFWFSICQTQPKHQNQILRRNAVCRLFRAVCERSLVVWQVFNWTLRSCLTVCTHRSTLLGSPWQQIKHVWSLVCSKLCTFGIGLMKRDKMSPWAISSCLGFVSVCPLKIQFGNVHCSTAVR